MTPVPDHQQQQGPADGPMPDEAGFTVALPRLLRHSLRRVLADEPYDEEDEAALRAALRDVCERARRDGIRAEHLLIVLKESWRELPERAALPRFDADEALGRVVSACINEYYLDPEIRRWDSPSRSIREADRIQGLPPA